jgi:mannose-6-phosphate isomerase-like protein (cupin superfamily)
MSLITEHLTTSRWLWFAGALVVVHVDASRSDGRLGMWESIEPGGTALPLHVHRREDEQAVVLEGRVAFWVGDRVHQLCAGDTVALPRGVPHAHRVTSSRARILTMASPGGFERLFTDLGILATPDAPPPAPPNVAARTELLARLGVETVGPPPVWTDAAPKAA